MIIEMIAIGVFLTLFALVISMAVTNEDNSKTEKGSKVKTLEEGLEKISDCMSDNKRREIDSSLSVLIGLYKPKILEIVNKNPEQHLDIYNSIRAGVDKYQNGISNEILITQKVYEDLSKEYKTK